MKALAALLVALSLPLTNRASPVNLDLLVVVGVPSSLSGEVHDTAEALLADVAGRHDVTDLTALKRSSNGSRALDIATSTRVVALGEDACAALADTGRDILCALISAEAFADIPCTARCRTLRAVVMDQPLERQIAIARSVYPALREFGVLSGREVENIGAGSAADDAIDIRRYDPSQPLPIQLNATLANNDALIALPESTIFNRSTLHVVLLTAYGYSKPVIGFSRATVKAGALISAYSTTEQVLREVLLIDDAPATERVGTPTATVRQPRHFSIVENPSIARSLGLKSAREIDPLRNYVDEDFSS